MFGLDCLWGHPSSDGGMVLSGNKAQVADDFIAAAMVRRMIDAVDQRHVGKTGSRLSGTRH